MASYYSLPYFATLGSLPAPLPTTDAIKASQDVLHESTGRRVVRVGRHFLIKYGSNVTLIEGENILFVGQHHNLSVPRIYAVYSDKDTKVNFIVMEHIEGETLAARWGYLDTTTKNAVAKRLRDFMKYLREIPCPGYFGSLGHRGLEDSMFWTANNDAQTAINGPSRQRLR